MFMSTCEIGLGYVETAILFVYVSNLMSGVFCFSNN